MCVGGWWGVSKGGGVEGQYVPHEHIYVCVLMSTCMYVHVYMYVCLWGVVMHNR